jgi:DNA end-binding protein Ku
MASVVWKGFVSFGLVSFPVRLQAAARNKPLRFNMLHKKDLSRVKEVFFCTEEDKPLQRADIVKGFEVAKGDYVVVTDEELQKIAPKTAQGMEILQFVKAGDLDPVFLDKSYHMLPDGEIAKPYGLLREAMKKEGQYAIAKVAMHNREHIVVIRPSGSELMLHTMFFADEIQRADIKAGADKFPEKEMQLAVQLIDSLSAKFQPERFHDEYKENVEKLIQQKQKGERMRPIKHEQPRPVTDILQALKKSIAESHAKARPESHAKSRKRTAA